MPRIKKNRFDVLTEKLGSIPEQDSQPPARKERTVLGQRQEIAASLQGKMKSVKHIQWDPNRIRLWSGHNREYAHLSEQRCRDLIDGFKRAGQQFPAIVRKVQDHDAFDYEIICGARRHWTATHLGIDLLVEERKLSDKDAFLLQDIENRDREDISDYERACDYAKALPIYFDGKMTAMAEQLQINKGNFSRFLALAELPKEIVDAYADIRELHANHMSTYNKVLKDAKQLKRVVSMATKLKGKQLEGRAVLSQLKKAAVGEQPPIPVSSTGELAWKKNSPSEYTVKIKLPEHNAAEALVHIRNELLGMLDQIEETIPERKRAVPPKPARTRETESA